jgi:uncharacterized protein (DUF488 family)
VHAAILTFGHGTLQASELVSLLTDAGVEGVVDVRRFPGSRHNPDASPDRLSAALADAGIGYRWDQRLGGRRHLTRAEDAASPDRWWRVAAFRAYAAHTRTPEFRAAIDDLVADASGRPTAIMCSESVWWRCHRRLIADVLLLERGLPVAHLMHDGRLQPAEPSAGARRVPPDGFLVWDAPAS